MAGQLKNHYFAASLIISYHKLLCNLIAKKNFKAFTYLYHKFIYNQNTKICQSHLNTPDKLLIWLHTVSGFQVINILSSPSLVLIYHKYLTVTGYPGIYPLAGCVKNIYIRPILSTSISQIFSGNQISGQNGYLITNLAFGSDYPLAGSLGIIYIRPINSTKISQISGYLTGNRSRILAGYPVRS